MNAFGGRPADKFDDHVDEVTCLLYLDGQLESGEAERLLAHTASCPQCRRLLASLEHETRLLHDSLLEEDEALPARLLASDRAESISWGWLAAFAAAAAGVYGLWTAIAAPWLEQFQQVGLGQDNLLTTLFFGGVFWKGWGDMLNLIETLSVVTIAVLLFLLVRRNLRKLVSLSMIFFLLSLAGFFFPSAASAAERYSSKSQAYQLGPSDTVHSDLVIGAPSARIDGTVEGDVVVFARTVVVGGHIGGDLIAWAQDIRIEGKVDGSCLCGAQTLRINGEVVGSVRGFAQVVLVEGQVDKNLMAWAQAVELSNKGHVFGSLLALVERIVSDGRVEHDLTAYSDRTELNGYTGGSVSLSGSHLTIGPEAEIHGTASFEGENKPDVSPQAKLSSALKVQMISPWDKYFHLHYYWVHLVLLSAACVLGLVFLFLAPAFYGGAVRRCSLFGASMGFGALFLIATPILAILSCFTLVGIPLSITVLFAYIVTLYSSQIVVGTWLGEKLLGAANGRGAQIGRMALGLFLLRILFAIPYVKALAWGVILPIGLGAVVLAAYDRIRAAQFSSSAA